MTVDMDWDELTIPYGDLRNSENAMEAAPDRYRYVLERPILGPPGVKWSYNGGCTTLLARLIADGTGEKLHAYARRVLFEPLGFGENEWVLSRIPGQRRAARLPLAPGRPPNGRNSDGAVSAVDERPHCRGRSERRARERRPYARRAAERAGSDLRGDEPRLGHR